MAYRNDFKYAAIILAREMGVDVAARLLEVEPSTLRTWMDTYEARVTVVPTGAAMRNVLAATLADMIMRISNAIINSDLSNANVAQLTVALGILCDKWLLVASMAPEENETIRALRAVIDAPRELQSS